MERNIKKPERGKRVDIEYIDDLPAVPPAVDDDYYALVARGLCPECIASLRRESGCLSCPACGWSAC